MFIQVYAYEYVGIYFSINTQYILKEVENNFKAKLNLDSREQVKKQLQCLLLNKKITIYNVRAKTT